MKSNLELIFVYNVELNPKALVVDFVHRIVSPDTYPCRLCDITYDRFTPKREWNKFIKSRPIQSQFFTKDRFLKRYSDFSGEKFPAVFLKRNGKLENIISSEEMENLVDLQDLINLLELRLS